MFERDQVVYEERNPELAYLANVLMAGCSIESRSFTAKEASDAAVAACNLGPAEPSLDVIAILDQPAWAALVASSPSAP